MARAAQKAGEGKQEAGVSRLGVGGWIVVVVVEQGGCACVIAQGTSLCISAAQPHTWCRKGSTQAGEGRRRKVGGRCEADGVRWGVHRWVVVMIVILIFSRGGAFVS